MQLHAHVFVQPMVFDGHKPNGIESRSQIGHKLLFTGRVKSIRSSGTSFTDSLLTVIFLHK